MMTKPRIGELLVSLGYLTKPQLEGVLLHQRQWGGGLGRSAVACGFCSEAQVLAALSRQLGFPAIELDRVELSPSLASAIPQRFAEQHKVVPIRTTGVRGEVLVLAMAPPASLMVQDEVRAVSRKARLEVYLASDEAVQRAVARLYTGARAGAEPGVSARPEMASTGGLVDLLIKSDEAFAGRTPDVLSMLELSDSTVALVEEMSRRHGMTGKDVVRRVVEQWAAARMPKSQS